MKTYLSLSYYSFILLIVILADAGMLPLHVLSRIPHYDWIGHFVLYGILCMVMYFQFGRLKSVLSTLILVIIGEELSQIFFICRTFSLIDILMGFLGVGTACVFIKRKKDWYSMLQQSLISI